MVGNAAGGDTLVVVMLKKVFNKTNPGLRNWLLQRLTAVAMATYSVLLLSLLTTQQPTQFEAWKALFSPVWMRVATLLFLLSLLVHAWMGVPDIFRDYVPSTTLRKLLHWLVLGALFGYAAWAASILWSI